MDSVRLPSAGRIHQPPGSPSAVGEPSSLPAAPAPGSCLSAPGSEDWFALVETSSNGSTQWALFCPASSAQHHVLGFLQVVVCTRSCVGLCTPFWASVPQLKDIWVGPSWGLGTPGPRSWRRHVAGLAHGRGGQGGVCLVAPGAFRRPCISVRRPRVLGSAPLGGYGQPDSCPGGVASWPGSRFLVTDTLSVFPGLHLPPVALPWTVCWGLASGGRTGGLFSYGRAAAVLMTFRTRVLGRRHALQGSSGCAARSFREGKTEPLRSRSP